MIASWWSAHALECVVWGVICALLVVGWFFENVIDAIAERQKKKKRDGLL